MSGLVSLVQSGASDEQILGALTEIAKVAECPSHLEAVFDQLLKTRDSDKQIRLFHRNTTPSEKIVALANTLLKTLQTAEERIPDDVKLSIAYHGKAISEGLNSARIRLATNSNAMLHLFNFVQEYVGRVLLFENQYLLRPSSSHEEDENIQFFTLSWREHGIRHTRLKRISDIFGDVLWYYRTNSYPTPQELITKNFPHLVPASPLAQRSFDDYVNDYVESNDPPAEVWGADAIFQLLSDPISTMRLSDPVLAPDGNTFSRAELFHWIDTHGRLPTTNLPCTRAMIRPNPLVARVLEIRIDQFEGSLPKSEIILNLLPDTLTGTLLEDPVMAPDGMTYSRASITAHLDQNQGRLPHRWETCTLDQLIPNRAIRDLIELRLHNQQSEDEGEKSC